MSLDEETLELVAKDGGINYEKWPSLLEPLLERLDQIVHNDFSIPTYPPPDLWALHYPSEASNTQTNSGSPTQLQNTLNAQKESSATPRPLPPVPPFDSSSATTASQVPDSAPSTQNPAADTIPHLLLQQLTSINQTIRTCFTEKPPHTIQRLAELVLGPTKHYKTLPAWLRAVDRVVSVSSTADIFPLPHALPLPGSVIDGGLVNGVTNGVGSGTGGGGILWTNSSTANSHDTALGSDESLGGALLTPIPWLKNGVDNGGMSSPRSDSLGQPIAEDSANLMVPEREDGAVTQGELIRQEQEAGVVPVNQTMMARGLREGDQEEDDVRPHARGPDLVGAVDMGMVDGKVVEAQIGGGVDERPESGVDIEHVENVPKPVEVETEAEADEDIVLTDADGRTEEESKAKADASGENVGPDAVDSSAL